MTREEVVRLLAVLKAAYPRFYTGTTGEQDKITVNVWHLMLKDYDYPLVTSAVKVLLASSKFAPSIADVIEKVNLITQPEQMTEQEAWTKIDKAIANSGYHAAEEFSKLPAVLQRLVGSPTQLSEWSMMDADTVRSVIASNFQRSYKALASRERELASMPDDVKALMSEVAGRLSIDGGNTNDN